MDSHRHGQKPCRKAQCPHHQGQHRPHLPRALDQLTDPVDQDTLVPSLLLGYGADGGNIIHRPGKGSVLVIGGYSGSGKSVLMHRLATEASADASVYIVDVAKGGADYRDISADLSALETTADGALARVQALARTRHTASILFVDYIDYTTSPEGIPGFREALQSLSDSGMPIIVGGQLPHRALPAALMKRADRILIGRTASAHRQALLRDSDAPVIGDKYKAVHETAAGSEVVVLPPGDIVPETDYSFAFGTDEAGLPAVFTPARDRHLLVTGTPGCGKTWLLRALAADSAKSMDVYVGTAGLYPDDIAWPSSAADTATSLVATADMLDELMLEAERRKRVHHSEASDGSAVPEPPTARPILIVLDEFASLIRNDPYPAAAECPPEDIQARTRIAVAVGKIARHGRASGMSLVMSSKTADMLQLIPGSGDIKANLTTLALGSLDLPARTLIESRDLALQTLRPGPRQGVFAPIGRRGSLVDIVLS